jgi:hypothetical protein
MCECGCVANDEKYWFPAPGDDVYILTLTKGCVSCDAAAGVSIELISKKDLMWKHRRDYLDGKLKFKKWADSGGVAIITGFRKHEFVNAIKSHLIGTPIKELDEIGAEVLLEEAYEDSVVRPRFPTTKDRA